jgi:hypothetical protein
MDLVALHQKQKALRKLIRALRTILQSKGMYEGSLLEAMDTYGVKLSELSEKPIVLRRGVTAPRQVRAKNTSGEPKTRDRGRRGYQQREIKKCQFALLLEHPFGSLRCPD